MKIKFLILCLVFVVLTSLLISVDEVSAIEANIIKNTNFENEILFAANMLPSYITNLEVETEGDATFTWDSYGVGARYVLEKQLTNNYYVMVKNNINTNSVTIKNFEVDTNYRVYAILNGLNSLSSNLVKVKLLNEKVYAQYYDHSALSNNNQWINNTFDGLAHTPVLKNAEMKYNIWIPSEKNDAFFRDSNTGPSVQKIYGYIKPDDDFDSIAVKVDDGVRLYIDINQDNRIDKVKELVIDSWKAQGPTLHKSNTLNLKSGEYYLFIIEYFNSGGGGTLFLEANEKNDNDWEEIDEECFFVTPNMKLPEFLNSKKITSFEFENIDNTTVINDIDKTINISVPVATDLTNLVATIKYEGKSISPLNNKNFSSLINYTVTDDDGSTSVYRVTVSSSNLYGVVNVQHYDHSNLKNGDQWKNNTFDGNPYDPVIKKAIHGYNNWISSSLYDAFLNNGSANKTAQRLYGYFTPSEVMSSISSRVDDGVRIYIDLDGNDKIDLVKERVINSWILQAASRYQYNLNFDIGKSYLFLIEYFNWSGKGSLTMEYKNSSSNWKVMPQNWFHIKAEMDMPGFSSEKEITSFEFSGIDNVTTINQNDKAINIVVPFATDITSLTPTIDFEGASINPVAGIRNFSSVVNYTVTAEDNSILVYTVVVTVAPDTTCNDCEITIVDSDVLGGSNIGKKKYNYPINFISQFNLENPLYNAVMSIDLENVVLTDPNDTVANNGVSLFMKYIYPEVVEVSFKNKSSTIDVSYLSQITSNGINGYTVNIIVIDPEAHTKLTGKVTVTIKVKTDIIFNSKLDDGNVNKKMFILENGTEYYSLMELPFHIEEQLEMATKKFKSFDHKNDIKIKSSAKFKTSELGSYINVSPVTKKIIFINRNLVDGE